MSEISRRTSLFGALGFAGVAAMTANAPTAFAATSLADLYPNPRQLKTPGKYYAQGTVFTRSVQGSDFPVDPRTPQFRESILAMPKKYGHPETTTYEDYARNIPIYITDSSKAETGYIDMTQHNNQAMQAVNTGRIPAPPFVGGAWGNDKEMALYDLGTGYMRDYYICENQGNGKWTSENGGFSKADPGMAGLYNLAKTNYWMQLTKVLNGNGVMATGSAAVVAMHTEASQIGLDEALHGRIGHAVGFMMANSAPGFSFPAQQGDGYWTESPAPVEGQWFRIPPNVNLADMGLNPYTYDIARAVQISGGYAMDRNAALHTVQYDSPFWELNVTKVDPWKEIFETRGRDDINLSDFPWHLVEWATPDWKGTAQATYDPVPTKYNASDWTLARSGSFNKPTVSKVSPLSISALDKPAPGGSGVIAYTRTMKTTKATTYSMATNSRQRSAVGVISVLVNGKKVASASSRGTSGRELRFTLPAGTSTIRLQFSLPDGGVDDMFVGPMNTI